MFKSLSIRSRLINHLLLLFILIACLLLLRNVINLIYRMYASGVAHKKITATTKSAPKKNDLMSYSIILKKNPFGKPMELSPLTHGREDSEVNYAESVSDIILVGTAVGPEKMGYAIFESRKDKEQEVFEYGDEVFGLGKLISIYPQTVEIEHGNDTVTIELIDIEASRTQPAKAKRDSHPSFVRKISESDYLLDREQVQEALENPEKILTDARLLPYFRNGEQEGFRIFEIRPGGVYDRLGLRNGDILLKINGLDISSPEVAIQAMSALRGMKRINLDIMRGGSRISLNYQIR